MLALVMTLLMLFAVMAASLTFLVMIAKWISESQCLGIKLC